MATKKEIINHIHMSMDVFAQEQFGEFGYDTCTSKEKMEIIEMLIDQEIIEINK